MKNLALHLVAAALASSLTFTAAQASTAISVTMFNAADFQTQLDGFASSTVENFENVTVGEILDIDQNPVALSTAVGTFETLGGTGTGNTVSGTPGNTGKGLYLRNSETFGRVNTTPNGFNFLDSNDTDGIRWNVSTGSFFDRILFTMSDAADTGATLTILANGNSLETFVGEGNGKIYSILISFGQKVDTAQILFQNSWSNGRTNDGLGLDDLYVGAAIPLPPAVLMLGAGVAALGALRRRKTAA